ncbi:MAG: right-handed parallel beta-helix repeat-containing protein [Deltaproteobacteria bacterium]|nr:right-handed parallel beta-helix repeat-containing protein [Deltaproteobacteria bacterium]
MRILTWLATILCIACGGDTNSDLDAGVDAAVPPADAALDGDAPDGGDGGVECVPVVAGMEIDGDTVLCGGEVRLEDPGAPEGAVRIVADDVEVRCLETSLVSASPNGVDDPVTYGFVIEGVRGVVLEGCAAQGFRYGAMLRDAAAVTIRDCDFSANFTDPSLGWVFDSVQGGGLRLERVRDSVIEDNALGANWNGIELRDSHRNTIVRNAAAGCSNTGGFLLGSNENAISDNDMSYGIRGDGLEFPLSWYGIDTRDSASLLVDGGSSGNRIEGNDLRYGGDGLFLRSVYGACPEWNVAIGNDTSFSPHNAIENWCDHNDFIDNEASESNYGLWLGGGDSMLVSGNRAIGSRVDGISIQIGESRHDVIEGNTIEGSGRVGLLLTGREVQEWDPLDRFADRLANSSHDLISRNRFANNADGDIYVFSVRDVTLASNCGEDGGEPDVRLGPEADGVRTIGGCDERADDEPPAAVLEAGPITLGSPVLLDGSGSSDPDGDDLSFVLTVTPDRTSFSPAELPDPIATAVERQMEVLLEAPGIFEANLTVDDGTLAALASTLLFVAPAGPELTEGNAASWGTECAKCPSTMVADDGETRAVGASSVRFETDAPFDFSAFHPIGRDAEWDLSAVPYISLFVRTHNPNAGGWQGQFPVVVLRDPAGGSMTLTPGTDQLRPAEGRWVYVRVPLADPEGSGWLVDDDGLDRTAVSSLEVHADTWDWQPYTIWFDGLAFGSE